MLSGHLDQRIYRFYFDPSTQGRGAAHWEFCRHSCVPYALTWGKAVCVAGNDQVIAFYDEQGQALLLLLATDYLLVMYSEHCLR